MSEIVVGGKYCGSSVIAIKEEVADRGKSMRHRKIITSEGGGMMTEDIYREKSQEDCTQVPHSGSSSGMQLPSGSETSTKTKSRKCEKDKAKKDAEKTAKKAQEEVELEARRKQTEQDKKKRQLEKAAKKAQEEVELEARRKQAEQDNKKREKKKRQSEEAAMKKAAEEAAKQRAEEEEKVRQKEEEDRLQPQLVRVYSSKGPCLPSTSPGEPFGVWKLTVEDNYEDEDCWTPIDVLLYPPNKEPENIDPDLPSGVWGYAAGTEPDDDDDDWRPMNPCLLPAGVKPPDDFVADGVYTYDPNSMNRKWPPPLDGVKKELRDVGKLKVPKIFQGDWAPMSITVYPKSKAPAPDPDSDSIQGIWTFSSGNMPEEDEDEWIPFEVMVCQKGQEPDDFDLAPHGIFGFSNDTELDEDGNWKPTDGLFYPPGETSTDDSFQQIGVWTVHPGKLNVTWPPSKDDQKKEIRKVGKLPQFKSDDWTSHNAMVHSAKVAPKDSGNDAAPQGVWKYNRPTNEPANADDWMPLEVKMYRAGQEPKDLDDSKPRGDWGLSPEATPDEDGKWKTRDVWFYAPGEKSADASFKPLGVWAAPPGKMNVAWPPSTKSEQEKKPRKVGKLSLLSNDWKSRPARVHSAKSVPKASGDETPQGVWKYNKPTNEPADADDWVPLEVTIYRGVQESMDLEDESQPIKVWGMSPEATPDEDGNWKPKDVWFYAPGEAPADESFKPLGVWALPPGKLEEAWPPPTKKISNATSGPGKLKIPDLYNKNETQPAHTSVGKLKIPDFGKSNQSPPKPERCDIASHLRLPGILIRILSRSEPNSYFRMCTI